MKFPNPIPGRPAMGQYQTLDLSAIPDNLLTFDQTTSPMTEQFTFTCVWRLSSYDGVGDMYTTSCGTDHLMAYDDRPDENFNYCPYCGHQLEQEEPEADDDLEG